MPPVNPNDEPIDIVARPVNPDGTVSPPEEDTPSGPDIMHLAFPGSHNSGNARREEVRYWRFEGNGDEGCGCGGCGCMTALVLLAFLFLLSKCGL